MAVCCATNIFRVFIIGTKSRNANVNFITFASTLSYLQIYTQTSGGSRIFPRGGAPTPKSAIIFQFFAENCMKMKEFGPPGGARVPGAPPLDPPMQTVADPGFPRGGANPRRRSQHITCHTFCLKLHENERNWTERGRRPPLPPLDPPMPKGHIRSILLCCPHRLCCYSDL